MQNEAMIELSGIEKKIQKWVLSVGQWIEDILLSVISYSVIRLQR